MGQTALSTLTFSSRTEPWSKLTGESAGKTQPLKLAKEPPDPATVKDCALLDEAGLPVWADPARVGPL